MCVMDERQRRRRDHVSVSSDALESFEFGFRSVRSRNTSRSDAEESLTYRALPTFHVVFCGEEPRQRWLKIDLGGTQIFSHAELFTRGFGWWLKSLHGVELTGRRLL